MSHNKYRQHEQNATNIAICTPSHELVHAIYMRSVIAMMIRNPKIRFSWVNNTCSIIACGRNETVKSAMALPHTHLFFIDADMDIPHDVPQKLIDHDRDIVGCTYSMRAPPFRQLEEFLDPAAVDENAAVHLMKVMPFGCMMIKRRVFETLAAPWFEFGRAGDDILGEDYMFCHKAREAGFSVYMDWDASKTLGHVGAQVFKLRDD